MKKSNLFFCCCFLFFTVSCVEPGEDDASDSKSVNEKIEVDLASSSFTKIKGLEDRQSLDSLISFLEMGSPEERLLAARGLFSNPNQSTIAGLGNAVQNRNEFIEIREAAAYALGQTYNETAVAHLLRAYERGDTSQNGGRLAIYDPLNGYILEAVGKCGNESMLNSIATFSNVFASDTAILLGQSRSIYRFSLRGITSEIGTNRMVELVSDPTMPKEVRSIAANYLYRTKNIKLTNHTDALIPIALNNSDPRVRMALAKAIEKSDSEDVYYAYNQFMEKESDYRVLVNMIRGFNSKPVNRVKSMATKLSSHSDPQVAKTALNYLIENGNSADGVFLNKFRKQTNDPELKYLASSGANKLLSWKFALAKDQLNSQLKSVINSSASTSEKIFATHALKYEVQNFGYLQNLALNSNEPIVASAALSTLGEMITTNKFKKYFSGGYKGTLNGLVPFLKKIINKNDPGLTAVASSILSDDKLFFKSSFGNTSSLKKSLEDISLPKDTEAYNALAAAIAYIEGSEYTQANPAYNNPFNVDLLQGINNSSQAVINTSSGNIKVQLFPEHAPSSVANFINLAKNDFYNDKNFHRVVPNFVIQGGCPRGDGYGSLDYTIRSELGPKYYDEAGYLGMASAGKNTEGTQWFITHSPTPHLDGKYTIFGKVIEGIDIVHSLRVGDQISSVEIIN